MPLSPSFSTGESDTSALVAAVVGLQAAPPPPPTAPATLGSAPSVSSTPRPGQGVALTAAGVLPSSAAATGIRMLSADPKSPLVGEFWYRTDLNQFSIKTSSGVKRSAAFT